MKTMGLDQLCLVRPASFPNAEASARASGAADVLHRATVTDNLEDALSGCRLVIGASARQRALPWPLLGPRDCARRIVAETEQGAVGVVFGNEQSGLSNEELQCCHLLTQIPANPDYSSLNLAMAVQVIAYEIRVAAGGEARLPIRRESPLATADELAYFYQHLERVLQDSGFLDPENPKHLMLRLRRLFNRAELDENEVAILRGILSAVAPGSGRVSAGSERR